MEKKHQTMKEMPVSERPYEKCMEYGPGMLSDAELLAVILRSGTKDKTAVELAREILEMHPYYKGILGIFHLSMEELKKLSGIGPAKAVQILAIGELSKRLAAARVEDKLSFHSPQSIAEYYMEKMRHLNREEMILICFNGKNKVIKELRVSVGTVNQTVASPRELFLEALRCEAVSVIMVHNHPSGDPTPSRQDVLTTKRMQKIGDFLGIPLSDHLIIGDGSYVSFREEQMM
ncbi:MAG TPA: DNA repair protein RadC [Candidatus Anaerostipes avistercoris]|uniref:DNA repair protein RadC n=1 Tax=Candidatus Anaerostipes avistercoris TaxID=2838462 RepID=A0A9D2PKZ2_9FIRM|nr:DNA repair protein RadC [Candidatus Anaerostipes avistercoris]